MKIVKGKEQEYKDWYEKNSDPYGRACFTCPKDCDICAWDAKGGSSYENH